MIDKLPRLQPGDAITADLVNALIDQVNRLAGLSQSAGAEVFNTPAGTQVAAPAMPQLELVELKENLLAHEIDKPARLLEFDDAAGEHDDKWHDTGSEDDTLCDVQQSLYLAGERRLCFLNATAGRLMPVDGFQWLIGTLNEPLRHHDSARMSVYRHETENGEFVDSGEEIDVFDWMLPEQAQLPSGSRVVAMHLAHCRKFIVIATDTCPEEEDLSS